MARNIDANGRITVYEYERIHDQLCAQSEIINNRFVSVYSYLSYIMPFSQQVESSGDTSNPLTPFSFLLVFVIVV